MSILLEDILGLLSEGVCEIDFTKFTGERRNFRGTLSTQYISALEQEKAVHGDVVSFWDIEKASWKSFAVPNLISITKTA